MGHRFKTFSAWSLTSYPSRSEVFVVIAVLRSSSEISSQPISERRTPPANIEFSSSIAILRRRWRALLDARLTGNFRLFQRPLFTLTLDGPPRELSAYRVWSSWRFVHSYVRAISVYRFLVPILQQLENSVIGLRYLRLRSTSMDCASRTNALGRWGYPETSSKRS